MKTITVHLLCLIACLPTVAATLAELVSDLDRAEGVIYAAATQDENSQNGDPKLTAMPGFPQYSIAEVKYLYMANGVIEDNAVAVILTPDGDALWHRRVPSPLERARQAARPLPIGTDEEIRSVINEAQGVSLADKIIIERGETSADVRGYIEVEGKLQPVHYYVAKNPKTGEWTVKPYEIDPATKDTSAFRAQAIMERGEEHASNAKDRRETLQPISDALLNSYMPGIDPYDYEEHDARQLTQPGESEYKREPLTRWMVRAQVEKAQAAREAVE